jgi:RND family efflux transporter MFP subunit
MMKDRTGGFRHLNRFLPLCIALALMQVFVSMPVFAQKAVRVRVAAVIEAPLRQYLNLSGSLRASKLSALSSQVDGYVTGVPVQAGDHVQPGQVVVTLDSTLPELELARLESALLEAESLLTDQQRRSREAADLMNANNFSRSEAESLLAEVVVREARLAQIKVQTAMQRTRVDRHTVRAPFEGVITEKHVEVGQRVSGAAPLLQIASMDPIWAEVQLPEQYLGRVRKGSAARLQAPTTGQSWIETSVSRVVPVSTGGSRTFLVRSELPNGGWVLAPGMSVKMQLTLDSQEQGQVLQLPLDAIVRNAAGATSVWLVVDGDPVSVAARNVDLGRRAGHSIEVLAGDIAVGDSVVIRGNENLQAGQAIIPSRKKAAR